MLSLNLLGRPALLAGGRPVALTIRKTWALLRADGDFLAVDAGVALDSQRFQSAAPPRSRCRRWPWPWPFGAARWRAA